MKQLLVLMLLLQCFCFCTAQTNTARSHFNLLSIKDGLPEGTVVDMLQDKEGYMWIATQKGLVRYDGYTPKVYDFGIKDPYAMSVQNLLEDSKGRLWATVNSGLYVYNGAQDNFINCLKWNGKSAFQTKEDAAGNIWLSMYDTLVRYNPDTKKSEGFGRNAKGKFKLDVEWFNDIYKDKEQRLWIGSSNGLYEFNAKENVFIAHFSSPDSSKQLSTWSIQEDAQQPGIFYFDGYRSYPFGADEAFYRFDSHTGSVTLFRHNPKDNNSIASDTLGVLYTDTNGRLWVTNNSGISLFDARKQQFTNYVPQPRDALGSFGITNSIREDEAGNLWCTSSKGLYYFNVNARQFHRDTVDDNFSNGLADNKTWYLFIDRLGIVWFSAGRKGLQWQDTKRSKFIQYGNDIPADIAFSGGAVNSFAKAPDGSIYMGTAHGVYQQLPNGSFKQIQFLSGKNNDVPVSYCCYDSKGLLWVGTSGNKPGLYCYDAATGKTIDYSNDLKNIAPYFGLVNSICEDHLHDIWIGTDASGIARFNRKAKTFTGFPFIYNNNTIFNTQGPLDDSRVLSIYEDNAGILWVGTNLGGLNRFNRNNGTFTSYAGRLPGLICVQHLNEDSKGRLWASTFFGGLFMLDKNRNSIKKYSEADGMLYDGIWASEEDNKGNIWADTRRGISILNPVTGKITNMTGVNNFTVRSAIKTNEGNFYFSTDNGFAALNPNDFTPDATPPIVHIEQVHLTTFIKDKPKDSAIVVDTIRNYSFRYDENKISFNYVGLYYKNPLATQYAYKLKGYDKDWVQAGAQRTVTYTNLSPGEYTFYVKAANADGVWSDGSEAISFTIMPPWWKTWWFNIFSVIAMIVVVYSIVQKQSRNLKKQNIVLEEKVQDRTKELKHSLEELKSTQAQLIQSEKMASLGELTAGIAHEIQNPLNFVNNFSEVSNEMLEELQDERRKPEGERDEVLEDEIISDIKQNLEKINHHGKRADAIVKGMLQHSRQTSGKKEPTDINALCDEYLRLSYHGLRAKDKSFNADFKTDFDESIGKINVVPQDIGRVLLNLINNAFYAVNEKLQSASGGHKQQAESSTYAPTVTIVTKKLNNKIEIQVQDNGNGIPQSIKEKIFQPFFTTKPTGQGTGLGLSLAYDIIKAHSGEIKVETKEGEGTTFIIQLPCNP